MPTLLQIRTPDLPVYSIVAALVVIAAVAVFAGRSRAAMSTAEAMARPRPPADARIVYADHASGFGDLRLPPGDGPFPVVVLVHGGCWLAEYDLGYMAGLAAAITAEGYATWTIEYRRVGEEGGGWPGTFTDVGAAADHVRVLAESHPLDADRVLAVGHSAGGHLALWLAGRGNLAADDPLRGPDPVALVGVVSLAGITDLAAYNSPEGCGSAVPGLLGGDPAAHPDRLRRASPIAMLPLAAPRIMISGGRDAIVPAVHAANYAAAGPAEPISTIVIDAAGHFELVTPEGRAWQELRKALRELCPPERQDGAPRN